MKMRLVTGMVVTALLSSRVDAVSLAVKTAPPALQTLAVSVPENGGIVLRLYRVGGDGAMKVLSRTRLTNTKEGPNLRSLSFSPNGGHAYGCFFTNGSGKQEIRQYRLASDGSLFPLPALPVTVSYASQGVTFSPNGQSAYVIDRTGIWQWQCRRTGELAPLSAPHITVGEPFQHHDLRREITKPGDKFSTFEIENNDAVTPLEILLTATGPYAYVFGHEYHFKGIQRVTSFEVSWGGTEVDDARFVIRYRVSADGGFVSPTPRIPLPVTTSSVVFSPTGRVLYAADRQNKTLTPYRLLPDGVSPLNPPSVVSGESICLGPNGHYAYVATSGAIAQYRVQDDGSLEPLVPASVPVPTPLINGIGPRFTVGQLRMSLDGKFLFARYTTSTTVVASYAVGSGGVLSAQPASVVPISGNYGFGEMAVLPALSQRPLSVAKGHDAALTQPPKQQPEPSRMAKGFAYVLNSHDGTISQYGVSDEGRLSPLLPSTVAVGGLLGMDLPGNMTVDSSQNFLYVPTSLGESVSQFRITTTGTLTPLPSPAVKLVDGVNPTEIAFDPAGQFAFVLGQNDMKLHAFAVGQNGNLSDLPADDLPFSPGSGAIFVNSAARMLLVRHGNGYVDSYRFGANRHLSYLAQAQPNLSQPFTFDPTGRFAFYGDGYGQVWQFSFGPDGSLKENTPRAVPADEQPESVAVTPDGRFVYAANAGDFRGDGSISCYRLDQKGLLTSLETATVLTGTSPTRVTIDPSGRFLYALDTHYFFPPDYRFPYSLGVINQYKIMPDGSLLPLSPIGVTTGIGASAIALVSRP